MVIKVQKKRWQAKYFVNVLPGKITAVVGVADDQRLSRSDLARLLGVKMSCFHYLIAGNALPYEQINEKVGNGNPLLYRWLTWGAFKAWAVEKIAASNEFLAVSQRKLAGRKPRRNYTPLPVFDSEGNPLIYSRAEIVARLGEAFIPQLRQKSLPCPFERVHHHLFIISGAKYNEWLKELAVFDKLHYPEGVRAG